jgi:sulfite reductase (ferredoxin)
LNPNERSKKDDNPLNVRARIENIYAHGGSPHRPGRPARAVPVVRPVHAAQARHRRGSHGVLEPHELDDEFFMLRVRIDGGQLDLAPIARAGNAFHRVTRATPPTSPIGRTFNFPGSRSRTCADLERA